MTFGIFPLPLDAAGEERARRLHAQSIVIDLLYWGPMTYRSFDEDMEQRLRLSYDVHRSPFLSLVEAHRLPGDLATSSSGFPAMQQVFDASGITGGHYPLMVGEPGLLLSSAAHFARLADRLDWVRKVSSTKDFQVAKEQGQLAWFGLCQPTTPISKDLSMLSKAYDLGLRVLMLTYNDQDLVGSGCTEQTDTGLSRFGDQVVAACNELGIAVDTAHCGRQTTLDACERSTKPVFATHTAAAGVYLHDRGKSDEELCAIAATGGVIGVVTVPFFLADVDTADLTTWLDHVDYISDLVGWQHVGIGTDWPMAGPKFTMERLGDFAAANGFRAAEHGTGDVTRNLSGFDDYRDTVNLTRGLVSRGYTDEQITGILGGNALRAFEQTIG
jgi:membrane dipeptidase